MSDSNKEAQRREILERLERLNVLIGENVEQLKKDDERREGERVRLQKESFEQPFDGCVHENTPRFRAPAPFDGRGAQPSPSSITGRGTVGRAQSDYD